MKLTRFINRFSEKNCNLSKWAILCPNIGHPNDSGSAERNFLKFGTMKGANIYMKLILITFQKKLFGANGPFWASKWSILTTLDRL